MPIYEYLCGTCRRRVSIFWRSFEAAEQGQACCPRCGGTDLQRLVSRVSVVRGAGTTDFDDFDLPGMDDLDENDPRSVARWMRRMSEATGEDLGDEFSEVVDRLEAGQSPEEIEESMPDLAGPADDFSADLD